MMVKKKSKSKIVRRNGHEKKSKVVGHNSHGKKSKVADKLKKKAHKVEEDFIKIGLPGFDSLFEKGYGVPNGGAVLVEGGPGSGKTVFCLTSIASLCKIGKKCLYMSFEEPEEKLIDHMKHFGWDVDTFLKKGLLKVKRFDALDVSRSVEALLSAAKKELLIEVDPVLFPEDFKPDFVVIDSLTSIASAFSGQGNRFRIYMEQLFRYLEKNKITNFLIREVSSPSHIGNIFKDQGDAVSFLSDGIIVLYNVIYDNGKRSLAFEILKMMGSSFKKMIVDFKILSNKGAVISPNVILERGKKIKFELT